MKHIEELDLRAKPRVGPETPKKAIFLYNQDYLAFRDHSVRIARLPAILYEMAELLELHAENRFKIIAFSKAARAIESLREDIVQVCREKRLRLFPVWESDRQKVEEYLRTGRIQSHQELLAQTPSGQASFLRSLGWAPRTIFMLHEKLNISNLE